MTSDSQPADRRSSRWPLRLLVVSLLAILIAFQCGDIASLPLQPWDESRLAVNAIEMLTTGNRIVTTYGFHPDLWNTKPPLAIDMMAGSMRLLGPTVFAVRLPIALAACATVVMLAMFVRRETESLACGIGAGVLLATAQAFWGRHSGQTGDYDALLTFFTTAYGFVLFGLIERDRSSVGQAVLAGVLIGLAVLTKGVAGLIPGVGIGLYALVFGWRSFGGKLASYAIAALTAAVIGGGFYLARSSMGGGYMPAVVANELGGRFGTVLDQHAGSRWYYIKHVLKTTPGLLWPVLAALPLLGWGRAWRLAMFALCQAGGIIVVYSSAATKLPWYIVPAMPFIALALALAGLALVRFVERRGRPSLAVAARIGVLAALLVISMFAIKTRYTLPSAPPSLQRPFGSLIAAAAARHMLPLVVVDTGFDNTATYKYYAPTLRFYILAAHRSGIEVSHATGTAIIGDAPFVGSCDYAILSTVAALGRPAWSNEHCVLVRRRPV